jgi:serine-type D-Ala-D-Ala carboxypeptidase (penicillin-binding protein 5/6)
MIKYAKFWKNSYYMNRIILTLISVFWFSAVFAAPVILPKAPRLAADAWVLMDFESGQVIASNDPDAQLAPASLTKMMTSYVASYELKQGNISQDELVTISENAWATKFPGSSVMFIEVGKQVSVEDLLKGIVIQSGNDASVAIAEHIAGTEEGFAQVMNYHAKRLGMNNTNFVNSTGLPGKNHLSTARDLAILARYLIKDFPEDYKTYSEPSFTFNGIKQHNRNELLSDASLNVDGIKTGFTDKAGYCLVSSGVKENMRLISVVLGTKSKAARKQESKKLLTYGFRYYETVSPVPVAETLHTEKVWLGETEQVNLGIFEPIKITIPKGQRQNLKASMKINGELEAPISKGQIVGSIILKLDGAEILELPLLALDDVEEGGFFSRMMDNISREVSSWFD